MEKKNISIIFFLKSHIKNHLGIFPLTIWIISMNFSQEEDLHERKGNRSSRVSLRGEELSWATKCQKQYLYSKSFHFLFPPVQIL